MEKTMDNYNDKASRLIQDTPESDRRKSVFMCDPSTYQELRKAKHPSGEYIWGLGWQNGLVAQVYGYRVFFDDMFPGLTFAPLPDGYQSAQPK